MGSLITNVFFTVVGAGSPRLRCGGSSVWGKPTLWFLDCSLLTVSPRALWGRSRKGTNPIHEGSTSPPSPLPKAHPLTSSHRRLGFRRMEFGGHKHLVHNGSLAATGRGCGHCCDHPVINAVSGRGAVVGGLIVFQPLGYLGAPRLIYPVECLANMVLFP